MILTATGITKDADLDSRVSLASPSFEKVTFQRQRSEVISAIDEPKENINLSWNAPEFYKRLKRFRRPQVECELQVTRGIRTAGPAAPKLWTLPRHLAHHTLACASTSAPAHLAAASMTKTRTSGTEPTSTTFSVPPAVRARKYAFWTFSKRRKTTSARSHGRRATARWTWYFHPGRTCPARLLSLPPFANEHRGLPEETNASTEEECCSETARTSVKAPPRPGTRRPTRSQ